MKRKEYLRYERKAEMRAPTATVFVYKERDLVQSTEVIATYAHPNQELLWITINVEAVGV